jgi:hypothetical protein
MLGGNLPPDWRFAVVAKMMSQADDRDGPARVSPLSCLSAGAGVTPEAPPSPRLLFLDDDPARAESFLIENPSAVWVQTVPECQSRLVESWDQVHLDHDLGGKTFVDSTQNDCGMEVIRWLCAEPREHLRTTLFFIHTHNSLAGLLMVLQMRSTGYKAEFRPFGGDPARFLADDDDLLPSDEQPHPDPEQKPLDPPGMLRRLIDWLKGGRSSTQHHAS